MSSPGSIPMTIVVYEFRGNESFFYEELNKLKICTWEPSRVIKRKGCCPHNSMKWALSPDDRTPIKRNRGRNLCLPDIRLFFYILPDSLESKMEIETHSTPFQE